MTAQKNKIESIAFTCLFFTFYFFGCRIWSCLSQMYKKDITPDEKQELDEALQREVKFSLPERVTCDFEESLRANS